MRIVGQDSIAFMLKCILYVLHYFVHEGILFDWTYIISKDIFYQSRNFQQTKRFYINAYLIYALDYYNVFKDFTHSWNADFN